MPANHDPVLLSEVLEALEVKATGAYVDGTFGRGGHATAVLARLGPTGRLLALDLDPEAESAAEKLLDDRRFTFERAPFSELERVASAAGLAGRIDGVILDLGVSSPQLDDPERGFSFLRDGPLDMRMDPTQGESAADWLADAEHGEISRVLKEYGEERHHRRIASRIVRSRAQAPIRTTRQLAELVAAAVPGREPGKHPATRTFQAIRIHVNRELDELRQALEQAERLLAPGGRLAVISFHSLEDRIVKRFIRQRARGKVFPPELPITGVETGATLRPIGKARKAGKEEVRRNPRSRSAILRVAERLP